MRVIKRLFFITLFITNTLHATTVQDMNLTKEKIHYVNEMSLLIGDLENGFKQNTLRSLAGGFQLMYVGVDFPIKPEFSLIYSKDIELYTDPNAYIRYYTLMLNGVYEFKYTNLFTPYLKAGGGYQLFSNYQYAPPQEFIADLGIGGKLNLADRWSLKFEVVSTMGKESTNLMALGGITFKFGRQYKERLPVKECQVCPKPEVKERIVYVPIPIKKDVTPAPLSIAFKSDQAILTDASKASIKEYSKQLNCTSNKNKKLFIIGNTDSTGSAAHNATLSMKRANSVRSEFIANHIDPNRISIDGVRDLNPIATNKTPEGRAKNRRAVTIINE